MDPSTHYVSFAAAHARGALSLPRTIADDEAIRRAREAGVRLHRFKRNAELPRVRKVLGVLRALAPETLLDVGTGRGTFLWPLLDAFAHLPVTCVEVSEDRAEQLEATRAGGVDRLSVLQQDVAATPLEENAVDVVTALEVLEHLPDPAPAARACLRMARRFVVVSVPSKPDDNPEHLRVFTPWMLEALLREAGARRVSFEHVPNHTIAVARVS